MADIIVTNKTYDGIRRAKFYQEDGTLITFYNTNDSTIQPNEVRKDQIVYTNKGQIVGTMAEHSGIAQALDTTTTSYFIPLGYHDGTSRVSIELEEKTVTPTLLEQEIVPSEGKVLSKVIVKPGEIGAKLQELTVTQAGTYTPEEGYNGFSKVIVDIPYAVSIDYSNFNNGSFTETLSDGTILTYIIEFDDVGNPISISNGETTCEITWSSET